jgi:hypothetical protein
MKAGVAAVFKGGYNIQSVPVLLVHLKSYRASAKGNCFHEGSNYVSDDFALGSNIGIS